MSEEPASKEFVDRAVKAEHDLTVEKLAGAEKLEDQKFKSRDEAIKLLADGVKNQKAVYLAVGLALLSVVLNLVLKFLVK
jgi:hypothetical protein